jgi:uncharacterized protein involved in outer membrane biogenesis
VQVGFHLQDGALRIEPFKMHDEPGSIDGELSLVPKNDGYALDVSMAIDKVHLRLMASKDQDSAELPPLGGKVTLQGEGNSLHAIMASSNGEISLRHGAGRVKDTGGSRLFGDILLEVLRTLNPLRRSDPYRTVDCGIYNVGIVDGVATINTMAMQTSRTTMVASGQVRLDTEKLAIAFRAKPREGIGIGVGTVTNSFLRLGGTLQSPRITLDARNSATATGAAVATGGLSLLARGLWDRVSAESSICEESEQPGD